MNKLRIGILPLVIFATLTGCKSKHEGTPKSKAASVKKDDADDHDHGAGPHGGTIFHFGTGHGEFTVNHKTKKATVYVLAGDAKKPAPIQTQKLVLAIKEPKFELTLEASPLDGETGETCSRFAGIHAHFGKEQEFEGTVTATVKGKTYTGDFKEEPEAPQKEKK